MIAPSPNCNFKIKDQDQISTSFQFWLNFLVRFIWKAGNKWNIRGCEGGRNDNGDSDQVFALIVLCCIVWNATCSDQQDVLRCSCCGLFPGVFVCIGVCCFYSWFFSAAFSRHQFSVRCHHCCCRCHRHCHCHHHCCFVCEHVCGALWFILLCWLVHLLLSSLSSWFSMPFSPSVARSNAVWRSLIC